MKCRCKRIECSSNRYAIAIKIESTAMCIECRCANCKNEITCMVLQIFFKIFSYV